MSDAAHGHETGVERSGEFGMFVFLASEGLLFGALVLGYLIARLSPGADFGSASRELSLPLGTLNTAILLTSSFCAALATIAADSRQDRWARVALIATALLGLAFLAIKAFEYWDEASKGLLPLRNDADRYPTASPPHLRLFFDVYLALTGAHALHLISGIGLLGGIAAFWSRLARPAHTLTMATLYWHFIDIVWVFLFPLLYLVR